MKIFISPAKSLDFESKSPIEDSTQPHFEDEVIRISSVLKKKSIRSLAKLLKISDDLARLNYQRNQTFVWPNDNGQAKQALFAFTGDVYRGIDSLTLTKEQINRLQSKLMILSGLYGVLRPLDLILPYRLEMGTKIQIGHYPNLYAFWKNKITPKLAEEIFETDLLVNLASHEYAKVIDFKKLKGTLITPLFKDYKNGQLKVIQFFAKKARGLMVRHISIAENPDLNHILKFNAEGYQHSPKDSKDELNPVFVR
ncbi:MAG: peroxide stress protein YaaA [Flavobacteriaceae bacterium]|nr:peroxide stress protein YaaA [Flavobacteriaceae bacterium]MCY4253606.1 peroxide stress protein YaaA [Flavobacteriaceae bacterium]